MNKIGFSQCAHAGAQDVANIRLFLKRDKYRPAALRLKSAAGTLRLGAASGEAGKLGVLSEKLRVFPKELRVLSCAGKLLRPER